MSKISNAFTLVELMVTIVIIGVLAAVSIPRYNNAIAKAKFVEVPITFNTIMLGQKIYNYENGSYKYIHGQNKFSKIGVNIPTSNYFYYYCPATQSHYWSIAILRINLGKHKRGSTILINEEMYRRGYPISIEQLNKAYFKQ